MLRLYRTSSLLGISALPATFRRMLSDSTNSSRKRTKRSNGMTSDEAVPADTPHVDGNIFDERFTDVLDTFRSNFEDGLESEGAAFAVFNEGKLVVDLFGGYTCKADGVLWEHNTRSVLFSTSKSICAIILAKFVDEGKCSYDDRIISFWPEFGQNGKEDITIRHVCLHQAGLPYQDVVTTADDFKDAAKIRKLFEEAKPVWKPGTKTGYHALSIGLLIDQIVRSIDERHRGIAQYFQEEIQGNYEFLGELSFGLNDRCQNDSVATIKQASESEILEEGERNPEALRRWNLGSNHHNESLYRQWPWITTEDYNKVENRLLSMPSNMAIGTARALAQIHSIIATGELLSEGTVEKFSSPELEEEMDIINGYPENKGFGFQFTKNPQGQWIFGHSGFGGQNVRIDVHNRLAFAYICNGLKMSDADMVECFLRLRNSVYRCIGKN